MPGPVRGMHVSRLVRSTTSLVLVAIAIGLAVAVALGSVAWVIASALHHASNS